MLKEKVLTGGFKRTGNFWYFFSDISCKKNFRSSNDVVNGFY